jgi:signal transduction histidine kinase
MSRAAAIRELRRRSPVELVPAAGSPDRAKDSFLAAMSHELRTPLNAIIGFAEIMDAEVFGPAGAPQYSGYVRDILGSARLLLHIIDDVLEISRWEAGELVLAKREVDPALLIAEVLTALKRECRRRGIAVVAELPSDVVIEVDSERLKRILTILLSNAVKFSADGTEIHIAARLDRRGEIVITVSDQGIGMDPLAVDRAFAPFVQLDDRLSRQFEGCGLGLPLARLLTEAHGGRVEIESMLGIGTTVTVTLPAYARAASSRAGSD